MAGRPSKKPLFPRPKLTEGEREEAANAKAEKQRRVAAEEKQRRDDEAARAASFTAVAEGPPLEAEEQGLVRRLEEESEESKSVETAAAAFVEKQLIDSYLLSLGTEAAASGKLSKADIMTLGSLNKEQEMITWLTGRDGVSIGTATAVVKWYLLGPQANARRKYIQRLFKSSSSSAVPASTPPAGPVLPPIAAPIAAAPPLSAPAATNIPRLSSVAAAPPAALPVPLVNLPLPPPVQPSVISAGPPPAVPPTPTITPPIPAPAKSGGGGGVLVPAIGTTRIDPGLARLEATRMAGEHKGGTPPPPPPGPPTAALGSDSKRAGVLSVPTQPTFDAVRLDMGPPITTSTTTDEFLIGKQRGAEYEFANALIKIGILAGTRGEGSQLAVDLLRGKYHITPITDTSVSYTAFEATSIWKPRWPNEREKLAVWAETCLTNHAKAAPSTRTGTSGKMALTGTRLIHSPDDRLLYAMYMPPKTELMAIVETPPKSRTIAMETELMRYRAFAALMLMSSLEDKDRLIAENEMIRMLLPQKTTSAPMDSVDIKNGIEKKQLRSALRYLSNAFNVSDHVTDSVADSPYGVTESKSGPAWRAYTSIVLLGCHLRPLSNAVLRNMDVFGSMDAKTMEERESLDYLRTAHIATSKLLQAMSFTPVPQWVIQALYQYGIGLGDIIKAKLIDTSERVPVDTIIIPPRFMPVVDAFAVRDSHFGAVMGIDKGTSGYELMMRATVDADVFIRSILYIETLTPPKLTATHLSDLLMPGDSAHS